MPKATTPGAARLPGPRERPHPTVAGLLLALLVLALLGFCGLQQMLAPENLAAWLALFTMCL